MTESKYELEGYELPAESTSGYIQKNNRVLGFASNDEGTQVMLQDKVDGDNQKWKRSSALFNGHFTLKSVKNNHYLHGNIDLGRMYIGPSCYKPKKYYDNNDEGK